MGCLGPPQRPRAHRSVVRATTSTQPLQPNRLLRAATPIDAPSQPTHHPTSPDPNTRIPSPSPAVDQPRLPHELRAPRSCLTLPITLGGVGRCPMPVSTRREYRVAMVSRVPDQGEQALPVWNTPGIMQSKAPVRMLSAGGGAWSRCRRSCGEPRRGRSACRWPVPGSRERTRCWFVAPSR